MNSNTLSAASQLLLRNQSLFSDGRWLLFNPSDDIIHQHLGDTRTIVHQYYDRYLTAHTVADAHTQIHFTALLEEDPNTFDGVIVFWPKAKQQGLMLCQHAAYLLRQQGTLLLVGENNSGIKSAAKLLQQADFAVNKVDSARHCTLLAWCNQQQSATGQFDPASLLRKWRNSYSFLTEMQGFGAASGSQYSTLPGTFSADGLDPGTALLLRDLPTLLDNLAPASKVLDFGCGNGVIASAIAQQYPRLRVTGCDINALSLNCAEHDHQINHERLPSTAKLTYLASCGLKQIDQQYQAIISNPPFHSSTATDHSITAKFIADASQQLLPSGKLRLVANRFLKYPALLQRHFGDVEIIVRTSKFTVYQGSSPLKNPL